MGSLGYDKGFGFKAFGDFGFTVSALAVSGSVVWVSRFLLGNSIEAGLLQKLGKSKTTVSCHVKETVDPFVYDKGLEFRPSRVWIVELRF